MPKVAREVPRVNVITVHRKDCSSRSKGRSYLRCACPKSLYWVHQGREFKDSAGTEDYQVAEVQARAKERELEAGILALPVEDRGITVEKAVELYLDSKRQNNYKEKALKKLELIIQKRMLTFCATKGIQYLVDVTPLHLEEWRSTWEGKPTSRAKTQGRAKGFFKWCVQRQLLERDPSTILERIEGGRQSAQKIPLTDAQFNRLLEIIDGLKTEGGRTMAYGRTEMDTKRIRALALLQRWSGLAISDALSIHLSRFRKQPNGWWRLVLQRKKTGVDVFASIAPEVAAEILAHPVSASRLFWDGDPASFDNLMARYKKAYARVNELANFTIEADQVPELTGHPLSFSSHVLRHTFAVWCLLQGMAVEDVAALLGHKNINITQQHYSAWTHLRAERLASIVEVAYEQWRTAVSKPQKHETASA